MKIDQPKGLFLGNKNIFLKSVGLTIFIIGFHYLFPSMLNNFRYPSDFNYELAQKYIGDVYHLHTTHIVFAKRFMLNGLIGLVQKYTNLNLYFSFLLCSAFFLFTTFFSILLLEKKLKGKNQNAAFIFSLSFPILFMYAAPIYTYDEPLQFTFIFLSLLLYFSGLKFWSLSLMGAAIIARENTLFLFPTLFLLDVQDIKLKKYKFYTLCYYLIPLSIYFIHFQYLNPGMMPGRFQHWQQSFSSLRESTTSIISMLLVLFPFSMLFSRSLFYKNSYFKTGFFISLIINTTIILLVTKPREARLFLLPLLPLFASIDLEISIKNISSFVLKKLQKWEFYLIGIVSYIIYNPTYSPYKFGFRIYFALMMGLGILHFLEKKENAKANVMAIKGA